MNVKNHFVSYSARSAGDSADEKESEAQRQGQQRPSARQVTTQKSAGRFKSRKQPLRNVFHSLWETRFGRRGFRFVRRVTRSLAERFSARSARMTIGRACAQVALAIYSIGALESANMSLLQRAQNAYVSDLIPVPAFALTLG